jgi:hypothetical protein
MKRELPLLQRCSSDQSEKKTFKHEQIRVSAIVSLVKNGNLVSDIILTRFYRNFGILPALRFNELLIFQNIVEIKVHPLTTPITFCRY